jgi:hypothetical protein
VPPGEPDLDLDLIREPSEPAAVPDFETQRGEIDLEIAREDLSRRKQERTLRKRFMIGVPVAAICWAFYVGILVGIESGRKSISTEVILALIASVTTFALGGVFIILRYLFPQK